jgi:LysR family transcriptional regulator, transcriptional activator of nhaA
VSVEWLNYHHLLYFWTVAREGSVTRASELLELTQPTVSTQVAALEKFFGTTLLRRTGRSVTLTDAGKIVYDYADEIFKLGQELNRVMREGPDHSRPSRIRIGVADVLPKLIVFKLLEPVYHMTEKVQLEVVEDKTDRLLAELALHHVDLVLTDSQVVNLGVKVKAYYHLLGECSISFLAAPVLAKKLREGFPKSLHGAPFLFPVVHTTLRRSLDEWFAAKRIHPENRGEFEDSALLKEFAGGGLGVFAIPAAIEASVMEKYGVQPIGRADDLREKFYAVTVERKLRHPAIIKITETARVEVFSAK